MSEKRRRSARLRNNRQERNRGRVLSGAPDIRYIEPAFENIEVQHHAIARLLSRVSPRIPEADAEFLKRIVMTGRRSDRDPALLNELAVCLGDVHWTNQGRPVSLFFDDASQVGVLATVAHEDHARIIVLTCFSAVHAMDGEGLCT